MSDITVQETAPFADIFATREAAQEYIMAWDAEVVQLNRRRIAVLQEEYRRDLDSRHIIHMPGGMPRKKDELVGYLSRSRFPHLKEASAVRAWHAGREDRLKAITMFSMQLGVAPDDFLEEALRSMVPAGRRRLRALLAKIDPSC